MHGEAQNNLSLKKYIDKYFVMNTTYRVIDKRKKNQGALMSEQNRHIRNQRRKLQGCQEKKHDKRKANENKTCSAAIFDLESVLPTPCSLVSQAYYKRNLAVITSPCIH